MLRFLYFILFLVGCLEKFKEMPYEILYRMRLKCPSQHVTCISTLYQLQVNKILKYFIFYNYQEP